MSSASRELLLSDSGVAEAVERLAGQLAPRIDDDWVVVCLLTGGLWFAADLMRALARLERHPIFDSLWLASYHDARKTSGRVEIRAGMQRSVKGRNVLLLDDVLDSGLSLAAAIEFVRDAGARSVKTAVFARKPCASERLEADFVAWEAPDRFLVGYGMDDGGRYRGLATVEAAD
jgi:hypoxanthine phosphoribosyltransferase